MAVRDPWFHHEMRARGVSRREFMSFCAAVAAALGLPRTASARIAAALETKAKPTLVWLEFQDCAGNTESLLRASRPSVAELVLDILSVDYHETIMAAAGHRAEQALDTAVRDQAGQYIAVVEGSIPTGADGAYCTIGGKSAEQIAREVCGHAAATIAVGTCAAFGGLPAASPNPTGARSVGDAVPGLRKLINLPACPVNAENLTATIVFYLTYGKWPATDRHHRPLFAYGKTVHDACPRRAHFDAGQYVTQWGDDGHRRGYCLYKMGCKGPSAFQNCPNVGWNENTNWPVGCGHPCLACASPSFWDSMTPFYRRLSGVPGFRETSIDAVGLWATLGVGAAFGAHSLAQLGRRAYDRRRSRDATPAAEATEATANDEPQASRPVAGDAEGGNS